ncbi:MAG TPA: Holliday junction resolvase RuvX [Candidatus Kapabacteria bacterium]|nr:Holliday junction resolvase RuvX [Candidatus Kapabacteria bacterium]
MVIYRLEKARECRMQNSTKYKKGYFVLQADRVFGERYRVLAIDYGTKRVGIAISDEMRMLASPRGVLENAPNLIPKIISMAQAENVRIVILGIPRTLGNTDSAMTSEVRKFQNNLSAVFQPLGITVEPRDERLTSVMANFNISERRLPKGKREVKSLRDEEAARILLQEYLEEHKPY